MHIHSLATPLGKLYIYYLEDDHLVKCQFSDNTIKTDESPSALAVEIFNQINQYFLGTLQEFNVPLNPKGTDFQKLVWRNLMSTTFGNTYNYQEMARQLGNEKCIRAAASANGKNPIAIIIPCHRVIGKNGALTGYSGGLWRKEWLLKHEATLSGKYLKLF